MRAFRPGSVRTFSIFDGATAAVATAYWSLPRSAISRLVCSSPLPLWKSTTMLSRYWWRIGSDPGSQFGFFVRTSVLVWP